MEFWLSVRKILTRIKLKYILSSGMTPMTHEKLKRGERDEGKLKKIKKN